MRSVLTHAALLLAALAVAYQAWNIDDTAVAVRDAILIWNADQEELASIVYEGPAKRVVLEQRWDDAGTYLWGTLIRDAASASGSTEAVDTTQFIVGERADFVLRAMAVLRAIRDLGAVDAEREQEYGVADGPGHLTVSFGGEEHELLIGGSVFAAGDRYVKDPSSGRVYVVISSTIYGIENAESVLLERQLHAFDLSDVTTVTVRTAGNELDHAAGSGLGLAGVDATRRAGPAEPDVRQLHEPAGAAVGRELRTCGRPGLTADADAHRVSRRQRACHGPRRAVPGGRRGWA